MRNTTEEIKQKIENTKTRLELLEELDLLESEYLFITNEYTKRKQHLESRLQQITV